MDTIDGTFEPGMSDGDDPRGSWQELWIAVKAMPGDKITPGGCVEVIAEGHIGDVLIEASESDFPFGVARSYVYKVSKN